MSRSPVLNPAFALFCHAQSAPERPALVVDDRTYTYAELAGAAGRVATWLRGHGAAAGSDGGEAHRPRVGVLANRSFETYAGILGAAWAGATWVPLNPKQPAARIDTVIERAGVASLIVDGRGMPRWRELKAPVANVLVPAAPDSDAGAGNASCAALSASPSSSAVTTWDALPNVPDGLPPAALAADDVAYLIFTSGTTGVPKGVLVTAGGLAHYVAGIRALFHVGPGDRVSQFFETTFDPSIHEWSMCFDGGAALHVIPDGKMMNPAGFIRQREITVFTCVPSLILMLQRMKQLEPGAFGSIRVSIFGGEGLPVASLKLWQPAAPNAVIENHYGPTEATIACLGYRYRDRAGETPDGETRDGETPGRGTLAIGHPFPGMHAGVVDGTMNFLGRGQVGELAVSGPQLATGYLGDDAQTARRFPVLDHPQLGRSRWYLTGDSAICDEQGRFHCLGRIDNQVKVMGHRVELEEVEAHLRAVMRTQSVAAVAWPLTNGNAAGLVAFAAGAPVPPAEAREALRGRVPAYMVPARVVPLDALPLSTNGKVDRHALRAILEQGQGGVEVKSS